MHATRHRRRFPAVSSVPSSFAHSLFHWCLFNPHAVCYDSRKRGGYDWPLIWCVLPCYPATSSPHHFFPPLASFPFMLPSRLPRHTSRFIVAYLTFLPFALQPLLYWLTVPTMVVLTFLVRGSDLCCFLAQSSWPPSSLLCLVVCHTYQVPHSFCCLALSLPAPYSLHLNSLACPQDLSAPNVRSNNSHLRFTQSLYPTLPHPATPLPPPPSWLASKTLESR